MGFSRRSDDPSIHLQTVDFVGILAVQIRLPYLVQVDPVSVQTAFVTIFCWSQIEPLELSMLVCMKPNELLQFVQLFH